MSSFKSVSYGHKIKKRYKSRKNIYVKKGGNSFKIDIDELEVLIQNLRKHANLKINQLPQKLAADHRKIVTYVELLYDSSASYPVLLEIISKYFDNLHQILPGTVGEYYAGCRVASKISLNPSCSPICARSMPYGKMEPCQYGVIMADRTDSGYHFTVAQSIGGSDVSYLYYSGDSFDGLNKNEKNQLRSYGVKKLMLVSTRNPKVVDKIFLLDEVKNRQENFDLNIVAIIAFAVIFLVLLFVVWRYFQTNKK